MYNWNIEIVSPLLPLKYEYYNVEIAFCVVQMSLKWILFSHVFLRELIFYLPMFTLSRIRWKVYPKLPWIEGLSHGYQF